MGLVSFFYSGEGETEDITDFSESGVESETVLDRYRFRRSRREGEDLSDRRDDRREGFSFLLERDYGIDYGLFDSVLIAGREA